MSANRYYVKLSDNVVQALKGIDFEAKLNEELKRAGVQDPTITYGALQRPGEEPTREVVLLILAVGAASTLVASAISKIIDSVNRGKHAQMLEEVVRPAIDGNGKAIVDANGNPVYEYSKKPGAPPPEADKTRAILDAKLFKFELGSGDAAGTSEKA